MFLPKRPWGTNMDLQSITKKTLALRVLSNFAGQACLGYVSSTNEYKIVASVVKYVDGDSCTGFKESLLCFNNLTLKLEEETSAVGSRRDLHLSCTQYSLTWHQTIHIKGFIYWLVWAKDNTLRILEMDLENEKLKTIWYPNGFRSFRFSHLADINGHLCMVQNDRDGHMLNVWMVKDHESEPWYLKYSLEFHETVFDFHVFGYLPRNNESGDILI